MVQRPVRVLIVDDQLRARKSLRALLSTWRQVCEVREAANGREALHAMEEWQPEVVLMDVRMSELNGLQATMQIKLLWPHVKVIVLSMYAEYQLEALRAGADAFVAKDEAPRTLLEVLAGMVEEA